MLLGRVQSLLYLVFAVLLVQPARPLEQVTVEGSPPDYQALCQGGYYRVDLSAPSEHDATGGPLLSVRGAASRDVDGVYAHASSPENETSTYQYYTKGEFRLLWEPPPRYYLGQRWVIFGGSNSTREFPLYVVADPNPHSELGWRGSWIICDACSGASPAPLVQSSNYVEYFDVLVSGEANGTYYRDLSSHSYPEGFKVYINGDFTLLWEPAPRIARGDRWVIFNPSEEVNHITQELPYYLRLSSDGDFGYNGVWEVSRGLYPPPAVALVQTVTCMRCPPGSYSEDNATECLRCPPGSYSLGGARACSTCHAGRFAFEAETTSARKRSTCPTTALATTRGSCISGSPGATSCQDCPAGHFSGDAAGSCTACAGGTFAGPRAANCIECPAGKYSGPVASVCAPCPPGRASNQSGLPASALTCEECAPGRFSAGGALECSDCAAGFFARYDASASCNECSPGYYSGTSGSSTCLACPFAGTGRAGRTSCY